MAHPPAWERPEGLATESGKCGNCLVERGVGSAGLRVDSCPDTRRGEEAVAGEAGACWPLSTWG